MWRCCYFRTEKTESSTVRLVPGGSCDGLQALLVRDDALDLTLSRPSSGFETFRLEAVMFRNPNWLVYRKPLRSSFCTCLSLSMSCNVVCVFLPATYSLSELTRLPLQWSDVATLIDTDFCNMHKRDTQLKRCEAADQESVAVLLFQN